MESPTATTATTSNFRSLPANYVSLAQLRERWVKERGGREDPKPLEGDQAERDCVAIAGEEESKKKSGTNAEVRSPHAEVENRGGERCSRVDTRERRRVGGGSRAEKSDGLEERPDVGRKSRVWPVEEGNVSSPSSGHWSAKREIGERNGGVRHGSSRIEDRSENSCLDAGDEIESGSKPLPVNIEIGAGSVSHIPDHKADSEPKDGVLVVNGWVRKRNPGIRKTRDKSVADKNKIDWEDEMEPKYSGYKGKKKGASVRRNKRNFEVGCGSHSESNAFNQEADIELKVMVPSILGGSWPNDDIGKSAGIGTEKAVETHRKDQSNEIRPELTALSVNEGSKKTGEKEDMLLRKNRKGGRFGGGGSKNLDLEVDTASEFKVMSIHGGVWRDDAVGMGPEIGTEKTLERDGKDQSNVTRPELKSLSGNGGLKKTGEKEDKLKRKNWKGGKFGGRSSNNLDMEADSETKFMVNSIHSSFGRDDAIGMSPEIGIEKTVERHGKGQNDDTRPELKVLSVNEGLKKTVQKDDMLARKNQKGRKFGGGTSNNLDREADIESKFTAMSIHGGFGSDGAIGTSPEVGTKKIVERHGKDQSDVTRPELKALYVNGGLKKNGEKEGLLGRKNQMGRKFGGESSNDLDHAVAGEQKLMVVSVHGGFWRHDEKDTSLERNREKQRPEVEPESVNEESKTSKKKTKKKKKKKRSGPRTGDSENCRTIGEGRVEANVSLEVGVEPMVKGKIDDQRGGTESESRTLSVNEGIESRTLCVNQAIGKKYDNKKQRGGVGGRNVEIWQIRGETSTDRELKVGVFSSNDSVGKGNRGNRNGKREVIHGDGVKTKVERNKSKKRNKESKKSDDCDQLTAFDPNDGASCVKSVVKIDDGENVESRGSGIKADDEPEFKALSVIGGTRNENGGFRRKTSTRHYGESLVNVPGRSSRCKKVPWKEDGVQVWVKKEDLYGGTK